MCSRESELSDRKIGFSTSLRVIALIPACPVHPKSGTFANAEFMSETPGEADERILEHHMAELFGWIFFIETA
jgi:hypothetical protein